MNWALLALFAFADDPGRIVRPVDKSAFAAGPVEVNATAPDGKLELDGRAVNAETPFPNVLHAKLQPSPGLHKLALVWPNGRQEIDFFVGTNPPAGYALFRPHPPGVIVACTQCHELSKRGRFRFRGGCTDCHAAEAFPKVHTHKMDVLAECGMCHNAHGSTVKAHLLHDKAAACKLCHN